MLNGREALAKDRALAVSRSKGCLLGLAIGDALGDAGRNTELRNRYGIVTHLPEGVSGTDDTEFAVLTARVLLDSQGELTREAVLDAWHRYVLDQGGVHDRAGRPIHGAAYNLRRGMRPPLSGMDNVMNNDDGAAMRAAPIGIVAAGDPERAARLASIDAEISHAGDGLHAAQAVAASVAVAMAGGTVDEIVAAGMAWVPEESWLGRAMQRTLKICDEKGAIRAAWQSLHDDLWTPLHAVSAEAIPQAYAILRLTEADFETGLFWAANFGRDADTIAAVVGAVCGARAGAGVLPERWIEAVRRPAGVTLRFAAGEDLVSLAEGLAGLIQ
ncbi:ADP-ribosylglycohydrolase family protein [Limnochorda pilosa]|uniref:Crystallin n=1 Tax=Limnochorda pilosa TaxID=1555112 RepID=A0A0K2SMS8_LIMPI|nr:ADP-ribosylglycohydrolase family protein [Limnochorda pilosa]BAS28124.1 crystallin [Limnochorda pilosa]